MPERSSGYADEGTQAHALAEATLMGSGVISAAPSPEMLSNVRVYTEYVRSLASAPGAILYVETKVRVTGTCHGTADAVVWDPNTATLHVIDLKYGAGVLVEVGDNLQLKIYALAAMLTLHYPAKRVVSTIVQPRASHPAGPVRSAAFDSVDLVDFHADLIDAESRVKQAHLEAEAGAWLTDRWRTDFLHLSEKGCRFCLAAPKCPAQKSKARQMVKQVFSAALSYDPVALSHTLDMLPILEGWIKNCREFAYTEAEAGRVPPRYKLVEKRATRKWRENLDRQALAMLCGTHVADIQKPAELLPVVELEKRAPGKNAEERAKALESYTVKESSGHTLVSEDDKRQPVRLDAVAAFTPKEP
jgi:hypothetical protein